METTQEKMDVFRAIALAKETKKVRRKAWADQESFLVYGKAEITVPSAPTVTDHGLFIKRGHSFYYWAPNQYDILETDWIVFEG